MKANQVITNLKKSHNQHGGISKISADTKLPYSWLIKLATGHIKAPSAYRVEVLADHFTKQTKQAA